MIKLIEYLSGLSGSPCAPCNQHSAFGHKKKKGTGRTTEVSEEEFEIFYHCRGVMLITPTSIKPMIKLIEYLRVLRVTPK